MNHNKQCGFASPPADPRISMTLDAGDGRAALGAEVTVTSCDKHVFVVRRTGEGAPS